MLVAVLCIAVKFNAIWYITLLCNIIHQSEVHFVKQCCVLCKVVQCTAVDGGSKVKSIPSLYSRRVVQLIQQKSGNVGQQSVTGRGLSSILKVFHPLRHNQPCLQDPKIHFFLWNIYSQWSKITNLEPGQGTELSVHVFIRFWLYGAFLITSGNNLPCDLAPPPQTPLPTGLTNTS